MKSAHTTPATLSARWQAFAAPLQARFAALGQRERDLVRLAVVAVAVLLVWLLAVQPAWRTLSRTPTELDTVDQQLQTMQGLAAEARELRAQPAVAVDQAGSALQAASDRLGKAAKLDLQGERAVLRLQGVEAAALTDWLAEARSAARARAVEAQLQRSPDGNYSGTITLALPGSGQ